jgi:ComF family protein
MNLKKLFASLLSLLYPKLCIICDELLMEQESFFCLACFLKLPKTNYHLIANNRSVERLSGRFSFVKATSYFYYNKGGLTQKLIAEIKYRGNRHLGEWIGSYLAKDLISSDFFQDVDYLVPIPLHRSKEKKRGFNQAEKIAKGIAQVTGIPMEVSNVFREQANTSQTKKAVFERWQNTQNIFNLKDTELFSKKHILLIDDVLTTGSTLEAVARSVLKSAEVKISILTLAIT